MARRSLALLTPFLALAAIAIAQGPTETPLSIKPAIDDAPTKAGDYDWMKRHEAVLETYKKQKVDLVFIGDSITHGWGGEPVDPKRQGWKSETWEKYYRSRNPVNLGFGWDRTEHVLWRFQNGELSGIKPKVAVIMIGTNNLWRDTAADVVTGIGRLVQAVHATLPKTKILLLGIFPRDPLPGTPNRMKIDAINAKLAGMGGKDNVTYLNIGPKFTQPGGRIDKEIMPDYLHLSQRGYEIWAKAMEPTLAKLFGDKPKS